MMALWMGLAGSGVLWAAIGWRLHRIRLASPRLDSAASLSEPPPDLPRVSILVPARNEILELDACLGSLLEQDYPCFEILLADDDSDDGTAERARHLFEATGRGRVLKVPPRPDGWTGKSWALACAAREASADWFLFADADVRCHPLALRIGLSELRRGGEDVLSLLPAMDCDSFLDRAVMPLFALLSALLFPMDQSNRPDQGAPRLSGAFMIIRRAAYEAVGGHAAIRRELLDDLALGRELKRGGHRIRLAYTRDLVRTRMYRSFSELWEGMVRFAWPLLGRSPLWAAAGVGAALLACWIPWLGLGVGLISLTKTGSVAAAAMALLSWALLAAPAGMLREILRILRLRARALIWMAPASALMCAALFQSARLCRRNGGVRWKGRSVPIRETTR
ncbi:MAG: glycosyltransferase [Kiritimatiellia bacterium]|nr:glycosyltransferase [Kiritimatiellia bacterium]